MKRSSFRNRLIALRERLINKSYDTLWIMEPENRRYLSGFRAVDPQLNESSGSLLINRKKALLITDSRFTIEAQREAKDFEIITLAESKTGPMHDCYPTLTVIKSFIDWIYDLQ